MKTIEQCANALSVDPKTPVQEKCPKCGTADDDTGTAPKIHVTIPGYAGNYCLTCWAAWIAATIPRMVPLVEPYKTEKPDDKLKFPTAGTGAVGITMPSAILKIRTEGNVGIGS